MSVAVRGYYATSNQSTGSSISQANFSVAPQAGDLLVAILLENTTNGCFVRNTPSISGGGGGTTWTQRATANGGTTATSSIYTKPWSAADTTYNTASNNGDPSAYFGFIIYAFSGANTSAPLDGTIPAANTANNTTTYPAPSVSPVTGVGSLLLCAWCNFTTLLAANAPPSITVASGMTAGPVAAPAGYTDGSGGMAAATLPLTTSAATSVENATAGATALTTTYYIAHSIVIAAAGAVATLPFASSDNRQRAAVMRSAVY